jgi:hypothetical protein
LSQPGEAEPAVSEVEEVEDFKEVVMSLQSLFSECRRDVRQQGKLRFRCCAL